jgi:hypothetical protein
MNGKPLLTNLTSNDSWHLRFSRRRCDTSGSGWRRQHSGYRSAMLYSLLELSTSQMTSSNPYVQHLEQKGYSAAECRTPAPRRTFPCTIGLRTFETEEQYQEALADFLNGYWTGTRGLETVPTHPILIKSTTQIKWLSLKNNSPSWLRTTLHIS